MLTACSAENMVRTAFPDRVFYELPTSDGLSVLSYACEQGPTDAATRARATQAHAFVERNIDAAAEIFADRVVDDVENGNTGFDAAISAAQGLNANADRIAEESEARFQCLLYDEREA